MRNRFKNERTYSIEHEIDYGINEEHLKYNLSLLKNTIYDKN